MILPDEIQLHIDSFLKERDLLTTRAVCKKWKNNADTLELAMLKGKYEKIKSSLFTLLGEKISQEKDFSKLINFENKITNAKPDAAHTLRLQLNILIQNLLCLRVADYIIHQVVSSNASELTSTKIKLIKAIIAVGVKLDIEDRKDLLAGLMTQLKDTDEVYLILKEQGIIPIEPKQQDNPMAFKPHFVAKPPENKCSIM